MDKNLEDQLAIFTGRPRFQEVKSSANLVTPNLDIFLSYLKESYDYNQLRADGPSTQKLVERLKEIHGTKYCITFPSCFMSIVACLSTLARPGVEVITPSYTYRRFGDIIAWTGLVPHYCEVDEQTLVPTVEHIEACITAKTAAILLVQPMVHVYDFEEHYCFARERFLPLIIDSVEAPCSTVKGKKVGSFGDAECYSLHASKLFNGFDGGYVTTNDAIVYDLLREFRKQFHMPLTEIHAAMTLASIDGADAQIKRNINERYLLYKHHLPHINGISLIEYDESEPRGYKNILVRLEEDWPLSREDTIKILHAENILARPYWSPPLHSKETYFHKVSKDLPTTDKLSSNHMLLPCGDFVSRFDVMEIISLLYKLSQTTLTHDDIKNIEVPIPPKRQFPSVLLMKHCIPQQQRYYKTSSVPAWENIAKVMEGIFQRRWFTSHGPLLQELESRLEDIFQVKHVLCVGNLTNAIMTSLKVALPEKLHWCFGVVPPLVKKILEMTNDNDRLDDLSTALTYDDIAFGLISFETMRRYPNYRCSSGRFLFIVQFLAGIDGSCICTNDDDLAEKVRNARAVPGVRKKVKTAFIGNARMSEAQAALILLNLKEVFES